jgi:hypothetical protein
VQKNVEHNPIAQDRLRGKPRYHSYGTPFFNYGPSPDPNHAVCRIVAWCVPCVASAASM